VPGTIPGPPDTDLGRLAVTFHLVVDPIACDGRGVCAELFPERIALDPWGYPIVDGTAIPRQLRAHANRAVAACPKLALRLERRPRTAAG
jgi:ferredoxin